MHEQIHITIDLFTTVVWHKNMIGEIAMNSIQLQEICMAGSKMFAYVAIQLQTVAKLLASSIASYVMKMLDGKKLTQMTQQNFCTICDRACENPPCS